jgi:hypothetical protein
MLPPYEAEAVRALDDVLCRLPLHDRLAALIVSIVASDPRAVAAVENLVSVAVIMARHLNPAQRTAIVWHLRQKTSELEAIWQ